jgi:integrase
MSSLKPKLTERVNRTGTISWRVDAGRCNGKRQRRFFATRTEASAYADRLHITRKNEGLAAFDLSHEQRLQAIQAFEQLGRVGATLPEAIAFYVKHSKPKGGNRTASQVAAELVATKERNGFKPRYVKALRVAFTVFNRNFGGLLINTITTSQVVDWLHGQPYSNTTKSNYLRDIGILFRFGLLKGYCADDVLKGVERPRKTDVPPGILEVGVVKRLLIAAQSRPELELLPGLAIAFFAGLRSSELEQLDWNEVLYSENLIEVTAAKSKTRQRRLVNLAPNLKKWLQPHLRPTGRVLPKNWRRRLNALLGQAGIKDWPQNCARHSFASFHLARHSNADLSALQLGHADTNMLFSHYRQLVRPQDARRYWRIVPKESEKIVPLALAA